MSFDSRAAIRSFPAIQRIAAGAPDAGHANTCPAPELRAAMRRAEVFAVYQPVVCLRTGGLRGAEALARWYRPGTGWVPAGRLLAELERHALLPQLTDLILAHACTTVRQWQDKGRSISISINTKWPCVESGRLRARMLAACSRTGISARNLQIELCEHASIKDRKLAIAAVRDLRNAGFHVAIDDFKADEMSLGLLQDLEFDVVKVDRSLVSGVGSNPRAASLVGNLVRRADCVGAEIVATGVETAADLECLVNLGCHQAQGVHYGAPMGESELARRYLCRHAH